MVVKTILHQRMVKSVTPHTLTSQTNLCFWRIMKKQVDLSKVSPPPPPICLAAHQHLILSVRKNPQIRMFILQWMRARCWSLCPRGEECSCDIGVVMDF